jgi:ubiquinone/menaquinone biosynthesis C-methylase UbiE
MTEKTYYGYPIFFIITSVLKIIPFNLILLLSIFLQYSWYLIFFIIIIEFFYFLKLVNHGKNFSNFQMHQVNKIINLLELNGKEIILDLGTGDGILAITLAKYLKKGKVFAIDKWNWPIKLLITSPILLSTLMTGCRLKNAKNNAKIEKVIDKCSFISRDFTKKLNFSDCYFDIIASMQSLYFIKSKNEQKKLFTELNRVLKIGGKIIFHEPNKTITNLNWDIQSVIKFYENFGYKIVKYIVEKKMGWKLNSIIILITKTK